MPFLLVQVLPLLGTFLAVALVAGGLRTKPKVSAALVFALLASLYPAWRASRLDPVEGLRRE